MNYFPFHVGDYSAHTAHLEPMEDLAYRRALDAYYLQESPLPADPVDVARLIRMRANVADVEQVLREFFTLTDAGWTNKRADAEIAKMQDKQAKARQSGLASAAARSSNVRSTDVQRTINDRSTDVQLPTPTPTPTPEPIVLTTTEVVAAAKAPAQQKGKRLPDDWKLPRAWGQWAVEDRRWPPEKIRLEGEKFSDYWRAKSGKDAAKLDWEATWRNWCRNANTIGTGGGLSFKERDHNLACARVAEMTGGLLSAKPIGHLHTPFEQLSTHNDPFTIEMD
jgi:uncharacterized protein YdaU (DUF1376 family)